MNAAILTIGDELMIGQIVDTNSAWIASRLDSLGWRIVEQTSCGDETDEIVAAIQRCEEKADLIMISGGVGPTNDDRTVEALCKHFKCETAWHEEVWQRMVEILKIFGREPGELHRKQCYLPSIAEFVFNDYGTAPGIIFKYDGKMLISVPGVPGEMRHLMDDRIIPLLPKGGDIEHRFIRTAGEGETFIAEKISDIEESMPADIRLAYLPSYGLVTLRLSSYKDDRKAVLDALQKHIASRLGNLVYATDRSSIVEAIGEKLKARRQTLGTGESCTAGYLAHLITQVPGSSEYFTGAVVSYSNQVKHDMLDVHEDLIKKHGAVSEEVVKAMAEGVRKRLKVDWALATSGIAGPGGATPLKPVGTVWIACAGPEGVKTRLLHLHRDRAGNIEASAQAALVLLWRSLNEK